MCIYMCVYDHLRGKSLWERRRLFALASLHRLGSQIATTAGLRTRAPHHAEDAFSHPPLRAHPPHLSQRQADLDPKRFSSKCRRSSHSTCLTRLVRLALRLNLQGHAGQEDQQKHLRRSELRRLSAHEMGFLQGRHHLCRSNVLMAHGPDLCREPDSSQMNAFHVCLQSVSNELQMIFK